MRNVTVDIDSPDPTDAINAFFWAMSNARKLGFLPQTEHVLAEQLFRKEVRILYYSSMSGTIAVVESPSLSVDDDADFDATLEIMQIFSKRRKRNRAGAKLAEAEAAANASVPEGLVIVDLSTPS